MAQAAGSNSTTEVMNRSKTKPQQRARNVCQACRERKKGCDKALPACGFCSSHQLRCKYDVSGPKNRRPRKYNPGRQFVALPSPSPDAVRVQLPCQETPPDHFSIHHSIITQPVEESLDPLVHQLTRFTGLTTDETADRYFQNHHVWFPIVSPYSFRQTTSQFQEGKRPPPADFSALLLAMLLIILPSADLTALPPGVSQESIYTTVKSAFAQAQASVCASKRLVQASLLIALREHTCVRPMAAYISLMTCASLARVLDIGTSSVSATGVDKLPMSPRSVEEEEEDEEQNIAWGIAMLERLILCEMVQKDLETQTQYLGPDYELPSGLINISKLDTGRAAKYRRQAQVVSLFEQLLSIRRLTTDSPETKHVKLTELDSSIRGFLEVLLAEMEWKRALSYVPVALCVRLLFLLHRSLLDTLQHGQSESDHQKRLMSWTGLDSVCRMMVDVVQWHGDPEGSTGPMCCFYNLRAARKCLQEREKVTPGRGLSADIDSLLHAEENYRKRWAF